MTRWMRRFAVPLPVRIAAAAVLALSLARSEPAARAAEPASLQEIVKEYEIEVFAGYSGFPLKTAHGTITGRNADPKHVQSYVRIFTSEFALYPPKLVRQARLRRVVLCTELAFAGQRRNAIPDFEHDTLFLEVTRGGHSRRYLRKVIHHDFFHMVDYRDDGLLYQDDRWATLNPDAFRYGDGGKSVQERPDTGVLTDRIPGFLNHYSTTSVAEDKAEVFANLIVEADYMDKAVQRDRVLAAKVEFMKELLVKFCPEMDEKFWEKSRQVKRAGD